MLKDLIRQSRSTRRFYEDRPVDEKILRELVDLGRLSPSANNLQSLRYILSNTPEKNALIFPNLKWAGYLKDWPGPKEGERPAAYIVILGDTEVSKNFYCDDGIAGQSILLGAREAGLAGCMLGAINREGLRKNLKIPERYEIRLVLALGKPAEKIVIDTVAEGADIKYSRDEKSVHHVPKRKLDDIILKI